MDIASSDGKSVHISEDHPIEESPDELSLLHLACHSADIGMIELLLQYGASIEIPDKRGRTPLHHSVMSGRVDIARLLLTR